MPLWAPGWLIKFWGILDAEMTRWARYTLHPVRVRPGCSFWAPLAHIFKSGTTAVHACCCCAGTTRAKSFHRRTLNAIGTEATRRR